MSDGFVPRRDREHAEKVEAFKAAIEAYADMAADMRDLALCVLVLGGETRREMAAHRRALAEVMVAIVGFDERAGAGDVVGATVALRAWLGRVRAS